MSSRLLSLLSDIEHAMVSNDPTPDEGIWETQRLINFSQGLARMTITVRMPGGSEVPKGQILLQDYALADGSHCMKANLSWQGLASSSVYAIYSKPDLNWKLEASQIANKWLDGRYAESEPGQASELIRAAG